MTRNERDDLTDKAHLYRGLGEPPSAHSDPPASVAGPDGLRQHPDSPQASAVDPAGTPSHAAPRAAGPARDELSYDTVRPRIRAGGGGKLVLGAGAAIGAFVVYLILKSGIFGAGGGHGGISPGDGGRPQPADCCSPTQPATAPAASPTTSGRSPPLPPCRCT